MLDVFLVGLDGFGAEEEFFGDGADAVAFADVAENFQFAVGEAGQWGKVGRSGVGPEKLCRSLAEMAVLR